MTDVQCRSDHCTTPLQCCGLEQCRLNAKVAAVSNWEVYWMAVFIFLVGVLVGWTCAKRSTATYDPIALSSLRSDDDRNC